MMTMQPCIRYRAWLACSGRIPCPEHPANPYEWAYVRESISLYKHWVQQMWSNYNQKLMPPIAYHGFTDPAFDHWLALIYLPHESTAHALA
jgi:hypothetical protein